jgi:hypothetical protein
MPLEQYVLRTFSPEEVCYWGPGGEGIEKVWEAVVRIVQDECVHFCALLFKFDPKTAH